MTDLDKLQECYEVWDISKIKVDERIRKDYGNIQELVASIKQDGLLHPIVVSKDGKLIAGERRLKAIRHILTEEKKPLRITVRILDIVDKYQRAIIELHENLLRKDLTWPEKVLAEKAIHEMYVAKYGEKTHPTDKVGHTKQDTARILGVSPGNLNRDLKIAETIQSLPSELQNNVAKNFTRKEDFVKTVKQVSVIQERNNEAEKFEEKIKKTETKINYIVKNFFDTELEENKYDLIEVDPPYGVDLLNVKKGEDANRSDYQEVDLSDFSNFLTKVLEKCYKSLKQDGWLILWHGSSNTDTNKNALLKTGFIFTAIPALWIKTGPGQTMSPKYHFGSSYEPFYYARKSPEATILKQGRSNLFMFPVVSQQLKIHPTEKPVELIKEIILSFKSFGEILVPFAGSGVTLHAANKLKMIATGYDLSENYRNGYITKFFSKEN